MPGRLLPENVPLLSDKPIGAYALTTIICVAAAICRIAIDYFAPDQIVYAMISVFPAVIVSSYLFGIGPGVYAATLCGLAIICHYVPNLGTFVLSYENGVYLIFYIFVVSIDLVLIHSMQRANMRLRNEHVHSLELARRTEVLFNELQHRVGNNLQMIGAVLGLQQVSTTDPAARLALANAGSKLELIGRIQRRLYSSQGEHLDLDNYLRCLVLDMVAAGDRSDVTCHFTLDKDIDLPVDSAIAMALIVAEAVANAVEHGFRHQDGGTIEVGLTEYRGMIEVRIRDNGAGLPDDFDQYSGGSLGIEILRTLASQLHGSIDIAKVSPGTMVILRMPSAVPAREVEELAA